LCYIPSTKAGYRIPPGCDERQHSHIPTWSTLDLIVSWSNFSPAEERRNLV
jgi:hypothetical protein